MTESLRATGPDLLRYFVRRLESGQDAADAVSDVFLIAWSKRNAAPASDAELRLWLYGVARNVLLNRRRGGRRARVFAAELRAHLLAVDHPIDFTEEHADASVVRDAIARLDADSAELIRLVHWEGMTIAEAAVVLAINQSTARSRYQTAKQRLRAGLRDPDTHTDYDRPRPLRHRT